MTFPPKEFRRLETSSGVRYLEQATGTLDILRLANGRSDYWISRSAPKIEKNKKLILADWTTQSWSKEKIAAVSAVLERLMTPGLNGGPEAFDIYVWQSGRLVPLTKDKLKSLADLGSKIRLPHPEKIIQAAFAQHKLPADTIHILDDYGVNSLLNEEDALKPRELSIHAFACVPITEQDELLSIINRSTPPIEKIIFDEFSVNATRSWAYLNKQFPASLKRESKYLHVALDSREISTFQDKGKPITLSGVTLELSDLENTKEMTLGQETKAATLSAFLKATPQIRKLSLPQGTTFYALLELDTLELKCLEEISIPTSGMESANLQRLLKAAPNLKILNLSSCSDLTKQSIILEPGSLKSLEHLNISRTNLSIINLNVLLTAAPNIKKLTFNGCGNLVKSILYTTANLKCLEEIDLTGNDTTIDELQKLILAAPKLKVLNLSNCRSLNEETTLLEPGSLPSLEEINLELSMLSAQNLQRLLQAAPNLKKLGSYRLATPIPLEVGSLKCLEELNVPESNITLGNLQVFCEAAPSLKRLNLSGGEPLTGTFGMAPGSLKSLETINLNKRTISLPNLQALLMAAPNLKHIHLQDTRCPPEKLELEAQSLEHVEELELCAHSFSDPVTAKSPHFISNCQTLFRAASHLKKLTLAHFCDTSADILFAPEILSDLEEIHMTRSPQIGTSHLRELLAAAPKLKILDISSEKFYGDDIVLEAESLPNIEEINLSQTRFASTSLSILLAATPHLKKINLSGLDLSYSITLKEGGLKDLEKCILFEGRLNPANFEALVLAAPNIKILDLEGNNALSTPANIAPDSLKKLIDLNLSRTSTTIENLKKMLLAAPGLVTLNLSNCPKLLDQIELKEESLKNLKNLILTRSGISAGNLKTLLKAAPNLCILEIGNTVTTADPELRALLARFPEITCVDPVPVTTTVSAAAKPSTSTSVAEAPAVKEPLPEPVHDLNRYRNYQPTQLDDFNFVYKGTNKTKNQTMIIEKISQYFTVTAEHLNLIPKLNDGICDALSHYYLEHTSDWDTFMSLLLEWNGDLKTAKPNLKYYFESLCHAIMQYQINRPPQTVLNYIGDNLDLFLDGCTKPSILDNPWHSIAVLPPKAGETEWTVYNPNFLNGPLKVKRTELVTTINKSLGFCITVRPSKREVTPPPKISNPNQFIREGGLLALAQCVNSSAMLEELKSMGPLSREDLKGILLRANNGSPAWVRGLENPKTAHFTNTLLGQFSHENPSDAKQQLQNSMAMMPVKQLQEFTAKLMQKNKPPKAAPRLKLVASGTKKGAAVSESSATPLASPEVVEEFSESMPFDDFSSLIDVVRTVPMTAEYERALRTWKEVRSLTGMLDEYCQQSIASSEAKKLLIKCTSTDDVSALRFALQTYCQKTSRPVFYINSPDDLICSAPHVYCLADNKGEMRRVGGPLYDFLHTPRDAGSLPPVLVVNYDNFTAEELVRFNSLLDKMPKADGESLPVNTKVIGLINVKKPDCYQGSDFYSRFDLAEFCPIDSRILQRAIPKLPIIEPKAAVSPYIINLFRSQDWMERLLGHWVLNNSSLEYQEGELQKAIAAGATTFEIQNGLWKNIDFVRFWQNACQFGNIEHAGRKIALPKDMRIVSRDGYEWATLKSGLQHEERQSAPLALVLNPSSFGHFFSRYQVTDANQLTHLPGFIEAVKGSVLHVHITRTLSDDEWAMLLTECNTQAVKLAVYCAPGVELPVPLQRESVAPAVPVALIPSWDKSKTSTMQVIQSTDIDTTVAMLTAELKDRLVIDISECSGSDILEKITGRINRESLCFEFSKNESDILRALKASQHIILKGRFSKELCDELAPILLERQATVATKGTLVLVSEDTTSLNFAAPCKHEVSLEEKQAQLGVLSAEITKSLAPYMAESLSQLQARRDALCTRAVVSSDDAWIGMRDLRGGITKIAPFDASTSKVSAIEFSESRRNTMNQVLDSQPYVFISGLSGVGKSTFIIREFCQDEDELFQGEARIKEWANATASAEVPAGKKKRKLLFLDEATLSSREWSDFEGLFATPPGILIDGKFHPLSAEHKVIFAGNPVSYGDERKLASLFQRHANAVVFQTMPTAVLYEKVLKPVFAGTELEDKAADISTQLLDVYRFLCDRSSRDILISPRELQMMALMIVSYCKKYPSPDIALVAKHFAYEVAKHLVPKPYLNDFNSAFQPKMSLPRLTIKARETSDFVITASRASVSQQLEDILTLRELRQTASVNEALRYGGLGGIVLEGEPGMGKSEMVIATLRARGYTESRDLSAPATAEKPFYCMPVSFSIDEKIKLLLKAFNEGAVVVIDEINSSPMMERLLNDLLMGLHEGERPTRPGFMIIGTQNPVTMAGRRAASTALSRRLITVELPPYTAEEMHSILLAKGLTMESAKEVIEAYQKQAAYAKQLRLNPAPTFRDVIKLAEDILKAREVFDKAPVAVDKTPEPVVKDREPVNGSPAIAGCGVAKHSFFGHVKLRTPVDKTPCRPTPPGLVSPY